MLSSYFLDILEKKEIKLLMFGLVGAGKRTILYKLRLTENNKPISTIGFNVETLEYQDNIYAVWHRNIGGPDKIRPLWRHFFQNIKGLIFVIDSGNHGSLNEARDELKTLLGFHELKNAPLLIFANKQDLKSAIDPAAMNEKLGLHSNCNCDLNNNRNWYIQKACAPTGDGLYEGLYWLANQLNNSNISRISDCEIGNSGTFKQTKNQVGQSPICSQRQ